MSHDSRDTFVLGSHDSRETFAQVPRESRETFARASHESRETSARVSYDVCASFMISQLSLEMVLHVFMSQSIAYLPHGAERGN